MRRVLVLALLAACGGTARDRLLSLRVAVPLPLHPVGTRHVESSSSSSQVAESWVFETLADLDVRGELVPRLAGAVERLGPRKVRVRLRPATFSDGTPLREADVVRSLAVNHLRAVPAGGWLEIEPEGGVLPLEELLTSAAIFLPGPAGDLGTGPFAVAEQAADRVVLRRRVPARGRIDEVVLLGFATPRDTFVRTLRGDADLVRVGQPRDLEFFDGVPRLRVFRGAGPSVRAAGFNSRRLSRDERFALVNALPPAALSAVAYGPGCVPVPSTATGRPLPPGRPLDVITISGQDERLALAIRRALGARGGSVRPLALKDYFAALKAGDFDLAIGHPSLVPPQTALLIWRSDSPTNLLGYSNGWVDAAVDQGDWKRAREELERDPPDALFCSQGRIVVADARVQVRLGDFEPLSTLPEWEVRQ